MTHTPGPWLREGLFVYALCDRGGVLVNRFSANVQNDNREAPEGEIEADARLIAAAPDLLDALRDLVSRCDGEEGVRADGSNIQTMRAHAVLAKIDGGAA